MSGLKSFLTDQGYRVVKESVHDKNQTRFFHFILEKDGQRYFCKANKNDDVYQEHVNSEITAFFNAPPAGINFIRPVETKEVDGHIVHMYPYIDQTPVSNESKGFKDFLVDEADLDVFFERVIAAIRFVSRQKVITAYERNRDRFPQAEVFHLVQALPATTPYVLEFLKLLAQEEKHLMAYELAIGDIQPQNMFWDAKEGTLHIFDLEAVALQLKGYDYARFAVILWCVCGRPEYAKRFLEKALAGKSQREKSETYRYLRANFARDLLGHYTFHKDAVTRKRIKGMMQWVRRDLLNLVNEVS